MIEKCLPFLGKERRTQEFAAVLFHNLLHLRGISFVHHRIRRLLEESLKPTRSAGIIILDSPVDTFAQQCGTSRGAKIVDPGESEYFVPPTSNRNSPVRT
jgi:hypothetical protein